MIGGLAAALRWGLPKDHPATHQPWLPALLAGFTTVTTQLEERFVPGRQAKEAPEAVSFGTFVRCLQGQGESTDAWLSQFLDLECWMRWLAGLGDDLPDAEEAYARYKEWLPFAYRADTFVRVTHEDLGREPEALSHNPGCPL